VSGTLTTSCLAAHSIFVALTINTGVFTLPTSSLFGPTTILRRAANTRMPNHVTELTASRRIIQLFVTLNLQSAVTRAPARGSSSFSR